MLRYVSEFTGGRTLPDQHFGGMFAALRHRNYRLWFMGQMISLVGTWMQIAAKGFLVFQLTHSAAYLGYVGFASGLPSWLFMLFGGVFADRFPRRKLLIATQSAMMVLAFVLAALTFTDVVRPWHVIIMAFGVGIANAFDAPARHSFVLEMVDREDLTNAIALNATMFNLGILIGPAAAGLIYAALGAGWCFALNGVSFVAVIAALAKMHLKPFVAKSEKTAPFDDFMEGIRYVLSHKMIQTLLCIAAVMSLFGTIYMTLIPAWAVRVLAGDATTNGWLLSARGLGALSGGVMIASLGRFKLKGRLLTLGMFFLPVMLIAFSCARWLPLSLIALIGIGWSFMVLFNTLNALIQTLVVDELRGRVVSIYTMCIFALMPLGALLAGWVAEAIGEPITVFLSAIISLAFAILVIIRVPLLHRLPY
jgi:MFS family permease